MVKEASAIFVATTTFLFPGGAGSNIRDCISLGRALYSVRNRRISLQVESNGSVNGNEGCIKYPLDTAPPSIVKMLQSRSNCENFSASNVAEVTMERRRFSLLFTSCFSNNPNKDICGCPLMCFIKHHNRVLRQILINKNLSLGSIPSVIYLITVSIFLTVFKADGIPSFLPPSGIQILP
ncbi:hypothetical protein Leryth_026287 [Lithospermum erythrorhizon]|nr:hypothetical protein Leryth_026287 [Lithospermum erythrorhizon]